MTELAMQDRPVRADGTRLADRFLATRRQSEALASRLTAEDQVVQSMPDCSPVKWHLAHVTWFFETFVLAPHQPAYRPADPRFAYMFNSRSEEHTSELPSLMRISYAVFC